MIMFDPNLTQIKPTAFFVILLFPTCVMAQKKPPGTRHERRARRNAGLSYTVFGIFRFDPDFDPNGDELS